MKIIGLCGGSGSGKGVVASLFSSLGVPSIDTDKVYHSITSAPSECISALEAEFGKQIILPNGALDRKTLSKIVFLGPEAKKNLDRLNEISHKYILRETRKLLSVHQKGGAEFAIVDAPLLFESGFDKECDVVIAVVADKSLRVSRICDRDGIDEESALKRISSQITDSVLTERSDFVINNNGDIDSLSKCVAEILEELKRER